MKLNYIIPKKEELGYRQSIVEDEETMAYNNGIVPFPKEKWDTWYSKWIGSNNPDYFYAYLFNEETKELIGEIAYRKETDPNIVTLSIIIEHKHRGKGYGKDGLHLLVKTAFKNGYSEVRDYINRNSTNSHKLFSNFGFKTIDLENSKDIEYRLTKNEYIDIYGEIK